jgi:ATP-dependent Lon protease
MLEILKLKSHLEMWVSNPAINKDDSKKFQIALRSWNNFLSSGDNETVYNGMIICEAVGDDKSNEGRNIKNRYSDIINVSLGYAGDLKNIDSIYHDLASKFPWADNIIQIICGQLAMLKYDQDNDFIKLPSILLEGSPGCGKTYLLTEIASMLGLPFSLVPCGGSADSGGLLPVARGWATSRACGPIQTILQYKKANPVVILDELEKSSVSNNNKNGSLPSALLSMMTGDGLYYDSCLQSNVDLSAVSFVGTANTTQGLPEALIDRFLVLSMGTPKKKHFNVIINNIIEAENNRLRLYTKKLPELENWELDTLQDMMEDPNFSIRKIEKTYRLIMGKKMFKPIQKNDHELNKLLPFL